MSKTKELSPKPMKNEPAEFLRQLQREIPAIAELKPLRVGIRHDIMALYPDVSPKVVSSALAIHCGTPTYLKRCIEGVARVGLDGIANGDVTEEHAQSAAERLAKLRARRKSKQQSQDKPEPVLRSTRPILTLKGKRKQATTEALI